MKVQKEKPKVGQQEETEAQFQNLFRQVLGKLRGFSAGCSRNATPSPSPPFPSAKIISYRYTDSINGYFVSTETSQVPSIPSMTSVVAAHSPGILQTKKFGKNIYFKILRSGDILDLSDKTERNLSFRNFFLTKCLLQILDKSIGLYEGSSFL